MVETRTLQTFRKKPVEIQAMQWTGDNADELEAFAGHDFEELTEPSGDDPEATAAVRDDRRGGSWALMYIGDWVVRSDAGSLTRCPAEEFAETYEPADVPRQGCGPDCSEGHTYMAGCAIKPPARAFLGEKPCGRPGCPCGGSR